VFNATFKQYFSYIMAFSFIGGGNWSTWRKPLTFHRSMTNLITWCCITLLWVVFELTALVVIGSDCIGSFAKDQFYVQWNRRFKLVSYEKDVTAENDVNVCSLWNSTLYQSEPETSNKVYPFNIIYRSHWPV
jgi:hypothetical protein